MQSQEEFLNQLVQKFLVHSFLYYKLDSPIIDDSRYDETCVWLARLKHTDGFRSHKYYHYIKNIDGSSSGFYISVFPKPIISTAFYLLYNSVETKDSYETFVGKYGYYLEPR